MYNICVVFNNLNNVHIMIVHFLMSNDNFLIWLRFIVNGECNNVSFV